MYGIYTYIWLMFMVNVGKYTIHGSFWQLGRQEKYRQAVRLVVVQKSAVCTPLRSEVGLIFKRAHNCFCDHQKVLLQKISSVS